LKKSAQVRNSNQVCVRIEELLVNAYLGAHAREQKKRRRIPVYLEFEYEQPSTDSLALALDYRDVRDKVLAAIEKRRFCLIETMARAILDVVRSEPRVSRVCVRVEKTRALKQARAVTAVAEWNRTD
jgi:FolB domain-containing protein